MYSYHFLETTCKFFHTLSSYSFSFVPFFFQLSFNP